MPGRVRPSLTPRHSYDAGEVEQIVDDLVVEIERLTDEVDATRARIRELEERAPAELPTEILGRAMILVQEIADKVLIDARTEAAAIVSRAEAEAASRRAPKATSAPPPPPAGSSPAPDTNDVVVPDIDSRIDAIRSKLLNLVDTGTGTGTSHEPAGVATVQGDAGAGTATPSGQPAQGVDHFAALRQMLDGSEPVAPPDGLNGTTQNGAHHLGPLLGG